MNYDELVLRDRILRGRKLEFDRMGAIKLKLAHDVTERLVELREADKDQSHFRTPLIIDNAVIRRIFRSHPETIAKLVTVGKIVTIALDESVEPPMLDIKLSDAEDEA